MIDWRPSASIALLRDRASLYKQIRHFFDSMGVLEVDTPSLSTAANPDATIDSMLVEYVSSGSGNSQHCYLHTSPEFFMKRLLSAGSGSIFQICHVFRNGEAGRFHNPEFNMLEWYRVGFNSTELMNEIDDLLSLIIPGFSRPDRYAYADLFNQHTGLNLFVTTTQQLQAKADALGVVHSDSLTHDELVEILFELTVVPWMQQQKSVTVYNYPASQASLASLSQKDNRVAERFEYYFRGVELANGFYELSDANEQLKRFEDENNKRVLQGKEIMPLDSAFLEALDNTFPDCSGVAVGLDRVLMVRNQLEHIDQVLTFPFDRC